MWIERTRKSPSNQSIGGRLSTCYLFVAFSIAKYADFEALRQISAFASLRENMNEKM